jgi:hypothetical protein
MKKAIIAGLITIFVIIGIILLLRVLSPSSFSTVVTTDEYFTLVTEEMLLDHYGQIVLDYGPNTLINIFSGLKNEDFHGVETQYGKYEIINGGIAFRPAEGESFRESATYISDTGMETLLLNLGTRLGIEIKDKKSVDAIFEAIK